MCTIARSKHLRIFLSKTVFGSAFVEIILYKRKHRKKKKSWAKKRGIDKFVLSSILRVSVPAAQGKERKINRMGAS